jgi:gliding-associated putative ABC transporter substrate-binding component GldG
MVKEKNNNRNNRRRKDLMSFTMIVAIILLFNFSGSVFFKRFDLTSEKRYTLSESTREMLTDLNDVVLIKVYLSPNVNAGFSRLRNETREILDEFRAWAGNNIQFEFITPGEGVSQEEAVNIERQLFNKGIQPEGVMMRENGKTTQVTIWPGALLAYKGKETVWQIFTRATPDMDPDVAINNSIEDLEYTLTNSIRKLQRAHKPEVTFLTGHHELDTLEQFQFMNALSEYYKVNYTRIVPGRELSTLKGTDALVITKPDTTFTDKELFVIDQFIMNGGKVLWLVDPVQTNLDSLKYGFTIGLNRPLGIEQLLFKYGVRLNPVLLQDMQCGKLRMNVGLQRGQPRFELFDWLYHPVITGDNTHAINKNLDAVKLEFCSTLDTIASAKGIKKTILMTSSRHARVQHTPARVYLGMVQTKWKKEQFKESFLPVACLLEGQFNSFVEFRLPDTLLNNSDFKYRDHSLPTKMIVVADGDVARNDVQRSNGQVFPLGFDRNTQYVYGNKTFLLNCMNYLLDDEAMLQLRAREVKLRLLDKDKIVNARTKWQMINMTLPLCILAVLALVQAWWRKRRYAA